MGQLELSSERPPILIGAGVTKDEEGIMRLVEAGAAAIVMGSFTEPEWSGNDEGGVKRVEYWDEGGQAYYNSIGLKNPGRVGASEYLPRAIRRARDLGQTAIISVATVKGEDPSVVLPGLVEWGLEMGADAVEINGSCPNQDPRHPLLCNDVDATHDVIGAVRSRVGPDPYLIYKVSALPADTIRRYRTEALLTVDAVDAINTLGNEPSPINPTTGAPFIEVNDGLAGMSGPGILRLSRVQLRMWLGMNDHARTSGRTFDMLSLGGVTDGREIYYRRQLGERVLLAGGVQAFRRAHDPGEIVRRWADEYTAMGSIA